MWLRHFFGLYKMWDNTPRRPQIANPGVWWGCGFDIAKKPSFILVELSFRYQKRLS